MEETKPSSALIERRKQRILIKKQKKKSLQEKKRIERQSKSKLSPDQIIAMKREKKKSKRMRKRHGSDKKRKHESGDDEGTKPNTEKKKRKCADTSLFVGQIPFNATVNDLQIVFENAEIPTESIRFLTDKNSKNFKGMAFVELKSVTDLSRALKLHHSIVKGRRINIERTIPGNGKSTTRKEKLLNLNSDRNLKLSEKKKQYLEKLLAESVTDNGNVLTLSDLDDRAGSAICTLPFASAKDVILEFIEKKSRVRNPIAFLMGMLKSKRGDTPEGEPLSEKAASELGASSGITEFIKDSEEATVQTF